jgi:hypothetical protein
MTTIYANYQASSIWDLDEICEQLEITRDKITSYYVKWDKLFVSYIDQDGDEVEEEFEPNQFSASENFDWKRPESVVEEEVA